MPALSHTEVSRLANQTARACSGYQASCRIWARPRQPLFATWAAEHGLASTRFDYSGHGVSEAPFTRGTIGRWLEEAHAVFTRVTRGPQVIVGSSMGGHIALLLLRKLLREDPVRSSAHQGAGSHRAGLGHDRRADVEAVRRRCASARSSSEGFYMQPSAYAAPYTITRRPDRRWPPASLGAGAFRSWATGRHFAGRAGCRRAGGAYAGACAFSYGRQTSS